MNKFHKSILPLSGAGTRKDVVAFYKSVGTHTSAVMHRDAGAPYRSVGTKKNVSAYKSAGTHTSAGTYTSASAPIKVRARLSVCAVVAVLCLYLSTCMDSMNSMLDDFNSNFSSPEYPAGSLKPGDEGFDERDMLLPYYYVAKNASLNIPSYPEAQTFRWLLTKLDTTGERKTLVSSTIDTFIMYVPDYADTVFEGTYRLKLELTIKSGEKFTDEAMVFVFDQNQINQ